MIIRNESPVPTSKLGAIVDAAFEEACCIAGEQAGWRETTVQFSLGKQMSTSRADKTLAVVLPSQAFSEAGLLSKLAAALLREAPGSTRYLESWISQIETSVKVRFDGSIDPGTPESKRALLVKLRRKERALAKKIGHLQELRSATLVKISELEERKPN